MVATATLAGLTVVGASDTRRPAIAGLTVIGNTGTAVAAMAGLQLVGSGASASVQPAVAGITLVGAPTSGTVRPALAGLTFVGATVTAQPALAGLELAGRAAPTVRLGVQTLVVDALTTVTVTANISGVGTMVWDQLAHAGEPLVAVTDNGSAATFLAPATWAGTTITIRGTVRNGDAASGDQITLTVRPHDEWIARGGRLQPITLHPSTAFAGASTPTRAWWMFSESGIFPFAVGQPAPSRQHAMSIAFLDPEDWE